MRRQTTYDNLLAIARNEGWDPTAIPRLNSRATEILGHPPTGKERVTWRKDGLYLNGKQLTRVL